MYVCDTGIIQDKYCNILWAASQEVIHLIAGSLVNTPDLARMSTVEEDETMGHYTDEMD